MPAALSAACLPLYTPVSNRASTTFLSLKTPSFYATARIRKLRHHYDRCESTTCEASLSNNMDLDLYDLMGIDSTSDQGQIKTAYRMLQKKCHPDIAGPAGHDMAIILNEAYSILSDPTSRLAYDKEQAKIAELRGYTGKPLYSAWFGSESEQRAVFVDEVKCVGCLKCALFAESTFAIESVYGRARVVGQWADPEHKIQEAMEACPVDCISIVERSDLAALEYLMSKQPRGNVRVGAGNSIGIRVSNIFVDVKKFQTKFFDAMSKVATKEADINWQARMSAIQAIRSISNWLYWQSPNAQAQASSSETYQNLTQATQKCSEPNIKKLRDAAAARKQARKSTGRNQRIPLGYMYHDEYWIPSTQALPTSTQINSSSGAVVHNKEGKNKANHTNYSNEREENRRSPIASGIPIVTAATAAGVVRLQLQAAQGMVGGLREHVGGTLALDIVNSPWLQVVLAGVTWYYIGVVIMDLIEATRDKSR